MRTAASRCGASNTGASAGGAFAIWLAARAKIPSTSELYIKDPLRVRAVFALAPAPDLEQLHEAKACGSVIDKLMGAPSVHADRYDAASAMRLAPLGIPQTLVIGAKDQPFGPVAARTSHTRARSATPQHE